MARGNRSRSGCERGSRSRARLALLAALAAVPGTWLGAAPAVPPASVAEPVLAIDPATGLVVADGWELVAAHCGTCHSHRLVTAQRGDAAFWLDTIRWMQRTQNLWEIPADQETRLVAYLETHYNETEWGRREPLAASLLPPPR